jgi:undecaprenyl-diphosphatase
MAEILYGWDVFFFRWVNEGWASDALDVFFRVVSDPRHPANWALAALGAGWLVTRGGLRGRCALVALALAVGSADLVAARLVKPVVARVRPCNVLKDVRTPAGGSGSFSFPSNHAADQGAAMTVLSLAFPPSTPWFAAYALLVGTSRVYLGLHYPSDILGGYVLGMALGILFWRWADAWRVGWLNRHPPRLGDRPKARRA